jgi:hypothetical protein
MFAPRHPDRTRHPGTTPQIVILFAILALATGALRTQAADATTASVTGTVTIAGSDTTLSGVVITATDQERGTRYRSVSDENGRYLIPLIRPGRFTIFAEMTGFSSFEHNGVVLEVGREVAMDIVLQAGFSDEIAVAADLFAIDPTNSQVASNISNLQMEALPLATRDYQELALLAPGVAPSRDVGFHGVVSAGGQEARNTFTSVDGADSNSFVLGGPTGSISQEAVQEFQIITTNFLAEYGQSSSSMVNAVTKSGSNSVHGSGFYFFRDSSLSEDNFFDDVDQTEYDRDNWGVTLGGPLARDRAFFFLSYDDLAVTVPTAVDIAARPDLSETVNRANDQLLLLGKIDFSASTSSRWTLSYRYQEFNEVNVDVGGIITESSGYSRDTEAQNATLEHQLVPDSGSLYNDLRLFWYDWDQVSLPNSTDVSEVHPTYWTGQNSRMPQGGTEGRLGFGDTLSWFKNRLFGIVGDHVVKVGAEYSRWDMDVFFELYSGGQFQYFSDDPAAPPALYILGLGDASTANEIDFYALFVQDEWRPTSRLSLNLGLRWDYHDGAHNSDHEPIYDFLPKHREQSDYLQPRLGFAFDLAGDGSAVVRGGAGMFYGRLFNAAILNEDIFNGSNFIVTVFPCYAFPGVCSVETPPPPQFMVGLPPEIRILNDPVRTPYTVQYTLGAGFDLGGGWLFDGDLVYARGYHELGEVRENLRLDPADPDSPRPHPEVGSIRSVHTSGESEYRALLAKISRRLSDHWQLQLAYTLSETENEVEFYAVAASDSRHPDPLGNDRGPGRQDQTHRVVANGTYLLPYGFSVSSILTYGSGWPWSVRLGLDANLDDSADQDRPANVGRNSERSDDYFRWDLRLAKRFDLSSGIAIDLIAEVFNVTNDANYDPGTYSNVISAPDFGDPKPTSNEAFQPRQWQLAARVTF